MTRTSLTSNPGSDRRTLPRTLIEDREDAGAPTRLWLTVVEQTETRMLPMPEVGELRIGRAEDSDVILSSPSVSRTHALLKIDQGVVLVKDMGSANGTRIAGKRVSQNGEEPVPPGVAILIGGASLVIHQVGGNVDAALIEHGNDHGVREVTMAGEHIRALRSGRTARAASNPPGSRIVVQSEAMRKLFQLVDRVAPGSISVLLVGETGVGKEVVAEAIHERSPRRGRPYLRLNCSTFAENLLESELFGYEIGAFSGARGAKLGLFETANGGTVLLDEIGEMPLAIQAKLLRVIETREVIPLGGTRVRRLDVRFLAATNRNLRERIRMGLFREDLYFRLSGVTVEVPPLRTRRSEIAPLAHQFVSEAAVALGRDKVPVLSDEALRFLEAQPWPGNVRELRNCVERAVLLATTDILTEMDLNPNWDQAGGRGIQRTMDLVVAPRTQSSDSGEMEKIQEALAVCGGNQTRAAAMLGIARRTLVKKMGTMGLPRPRG